MSITDLLQADQRIFVGAASNEPVSLLEELQTETLPQNLRFIQFPLGGMNSTDFTSFSPTASVETFFMTPALAKAEDPDRVLFKPMQMRWVYDYLCKDIDVAMIQVARDRMGTLRLGPNTDFIGAVLTSADVVLAELNTNIVAPAGAPMIPEGRIDLLVESARSVPEMAPAKIDAAATRIGTLVAGLIEDGDCLQTGIGAIPAAILGQLDDLSMG